MEGLGAEDSEYAQIADMLKRMKNLLIEKMHCFSFCWKTLWGEGA